FRGILHHLRPGRIPGHHALVTRPGGDVVELPAPHVREHRLDADLDPLHGPQRDRRARRVRLQATVSPPPATAAGRAQRHAAALTVAAVMSSSFPRTMSVSTVSTPTSIPSTARGAIAGPDAYASRQP